MRLAAAAVMAATVGGMPAWAEKHGGILKMYSPDSPASMSILEEGTVFAQGADDGGFQQSGHLRPAGETPSRWPSTKKIAGA